MRAVREYAALRRVRVTSTLIIADERGAAAPSIFPSINLAAWRAAGLPKEMEFN